MLSQPGCISVTKPFLRRPYSSAASGSSHSFSVPSPAAFCAENVDDIRAGAPKELKHTQDYLSACCFGDLYTRGTPDLKARELITFCTICCLGDCEPQAKIYAGANLIRNVCRSSASPVPLTSVPSLTGNEDRVAVIWFGSSTEEFAISSPCQMPRTLWRPGFSGAKND